ncbi:hypothetical protein ACFX12_030227 [Malus domestica]
MNDNMGVETTNPEYFDFEHYYTLEGYTYDLLAILEELHVKSCTFVGHSASAMVCVIAAVTRPSQTLSEPAMAALQYNFSQEPNLQISSQRCHCRS